MTARTPWSLLLVLLLATAAGLAVASEDAAGRLAAAFEETPRPEGLPWQWSFARFLVVDVAIDGAIAQEWLPPGVTIADPPTASYYVAVYPDSVCCGPYNEAGLVLYVEHEGQPRKHCPWMLVTLDEALVKGRDSWGFPKKLGDEITLSLDPASRQVGARVVRHGVTLVELQGTVVSRNDSAPPVLGGEWANVWGVEPHPYIGGGIVSTPRVLVLDFAEQDLLVGNVGLDVATIRGSERDPIDEILPGPVLGARLYLLNFGLPSDPEPVARDEVSPEWFERTKALRYD